MLREKKIGFIGGGNMAEAIIKGLLTGGVPCGNITVAEPLEKRKAYLSEHYEIGTTSNNSDAALFGDIVILAVKPQTCLEALRALGKKSTEKKLFISIMAGVPTKTIEAELSELARVIRVMPNTPALVLEAASAISPGVNAAQDDVTLALEIFNLLGTACSVPEKLLDAVTGLSGSGPAYVFTFIEALSDAGVKNGLPRDVATRLAAQTVFGSAKMVLETGEHAALLKEKVTSPGGTTIAGMHVLEKEGFRGTVMTAVDAATSRSGELGKG
ncbi:MAG: pyrroline-5-carboxylate reductase [Deltaproteobacteria bacterium]|nr:pyrroline-5-carboxylate reductase [Deltaproteobacteria bacterium]